MGLSAEARERRRGRVTASVVAACLGLDPYMSPREAYHVVRGEREFEGNEATRLGNKLEPVVLDLFREATGEEIVDFQVWRDDAPGKIIAATLDATLKTPRSVEAKTSGMVSRIDPAQWGEEGTDQIPERNVIQCTAQMIAAPDLEMVYQPVLLGGHGFRLYRVERNAELIEVVAEGVRRFTMDYLAKSVLPPADHRDVDALKVFDSRPDVTVPIPVQLVEDYDSLRAAAQLADQMKQDAAAKLLALFKRAEADAGECPGWSVTYRRCKDGTRLDTAKLEREFPEAFRACQVPKPGFRSLRVTARKGGAA